MLPRSVSAESGNLSTIYDLQFNNKIPREKARDDGSLLNKKNLIDFSASHDFSTGPEKTVRAWSFRACRERSVSFYEQHFYSIKYKQA